MKSIELLTDSELDEIIDGSLMAYIRPGRKSLWPQNLKPAALTWRQKPDYMRYSCGCCGYESLSSFFNLPDMQLRQYRRNTAIHHPDHRFRMKCRRMEAVPTTATPAMARAGGKGVIVILLEVVERRWNMSS
jgi:hypothetical protein